MFFKLVHEVGNRQRWVTTGTMTTASAERIADDVSGIIGVSGVRVNPRTGSVIVFYDNACGLSPVAEYLKSLAVVPPILRDARKIHVDTAKKAQTESRAALSVFCWGAGCIHGCASVALNASASCFIASVASTQPGSQRASVGRT